MVPEVGSPPHLALHRARPVEGDHSEDGHSVRALARATAIRHPYDRASLPLRGVSPGAYPLRQLADADQAATRLASDAAVLADRPLDRPAWRAGAPHAPGRPALRRRGRASRGLHRCRCRSGLHWLGVDDQRELGAHGVPRRPRGEAGLCAGRDPRRLGRVVRGPLAGSAGQRGAPGLRCVQCALREDRRARVVVPPLRSDRPSRGRRHYGRSIAERSPDYRHALRL
mmetsp:Transcript_68949/g.199660  ORF Transcript_68949/g.199660 Transcript_68949/m.199660 type:complete len:227 (+) Transcript_68949:523-1203(+)